MNYTETHTVEDFQGWAKNFTSLLESNDQNSERYKVKFSRYNVNVLNTIGEYAWQQRYLTDHTLVYDTVETPTKNVTQVLHYVQIPPGSILGFTDWGPKRTVPIHNQQTNCTAMANKATSYYKIYVAESTDCSDSDNLRIAQDNYKEWIDYNKILDIDLVQAQFITV